MNGIPAARRLAMLVTLGMALSLSVNVGSSHARVVAAPSAQTATRDIATDICGLLTKPVSYGVNKLIQWISRGRIRGSVAGTLFAKFGFKPWCNSQSSRLEPLITGVSRERPAYRARLGPFVFDLRATYSRDARRPGSNLFTVTWQEYSFTSALRTFYLSYSLNGGRWQVLPNKRVYVARGARIRFAVRVDNYDNISSPWVFSPTYNSPL